MKSQANIAFAATLRKLRNDRGLSQYALAKATDLDRTYISLLERGLRSPTLDTLLALARSLDVPLVDLIAPVELTLEANHQAQASHE
ncbi:helix-turn-helix domain-containing protein [Burkholderia ubonensis]|uniref:HTH cro/C1-type domain-containing protein n=1 Tax=Burkholderia ubonensis subsp. mesacidophila TaxID=265293 RepID=A0A2A4FCA5_9BURK|nr:helix-turn-helix transcriptional regulator [Burkholderia ubonensis]PCE30056.1 hypothetical protein BZL54_23105 [Burkholderia ubonensis subsp. mesacidophila]